MFRPGEDLSALERAYHFSREHHGEQLRKSGEPYMIHPLAVAQTLAEMRMDLVSLQTGLLHDLVEDTRVTLDDIRKQFGAEVARCVDGVTKIGRVEFHSAEERQAESFRKMLLAMVNDLRVILVKLADRLHNLHTLQFLEPERRERMARETLDIYVPIAHRLGMGKVRGELEDLAFQWADPLAFKEIGGVIQERRGELERLLAVVRDKIEYELAAEHVPARVEGRIKRPYSVYTKLKRQKIAIEQVYDLLALRIITDSVKNCYAALGVIHEHWTPVPGRIKDFIAIPRPNMYQSLHTSVIGPEGQHFEVQIRTEEMHQVAEDGIAAHWKYKEGKDAMVEDDRRIAWLRHLVEWQREMQDPSDFMSTLRVDLYPDEVYTFTPRGKVITLPRDATPIDFAYAIHSEVGNTCAGAKVNGRIVPLRCSLKNGDTVEIIAQPGHQPSRDWLSLVKTARARNRIRHVINTIERARAIEIGQKYLEKEARRLKVQLARIGAEELARVAAGYGMARVDDLYAALGYGKYSARQVLQKAAPDVVQEPAQEPAPESAAAVPGTERGGQPSDVLRVKGIDDVLIYRAKCCNPIRGEGIVGYVTRGKGVAVHSKTCANVQNLLYDAERKVEVEWERSASEQFPVHLVIHTDDRPGMLNHLTSILTNESSNIRSLEARTELNHGADGALVEMTVDVRDKRQLERLVTSMRRVSGVRDVERVVN